MARTTKEESLKTRQKIIDTAIELFYQQGVSSVTLEQIAEAAGLTRGAIYWHFDNKLAVVSAIHEQFHVSIMDTMYAQLSDLSLTPLERIRKSSEDFLTSLSTDEQRRKVLTIFFLKCDYSGDLADFLKTQNEKRIFGQKLYTQCFQEAIDRRDIDESRSADFLAIAHMSFMTGVLMEYLRGGQEDFIDRHVKPLLYFFLNALPLGANIPPLL